MPFKFVHNLGLIATIAIVAGAAATAAQARGLVSEVESARANARAGGPTNARDAELLERYGALSGTVKRDWRTGRVIDNSDAERPRRKRRD